MHLVKHPPWPLCNPTGWRLLTSVRPSPPIDRVNGPCLVAAWSQGGSSETTPRWQATIHIFRSFPSVCEGYFHFAQTTIKLPQKIDTLAIVSIILLEPLCLLPYRHKQD